MRDLGVGDVIHAERAFRPQWKGSPRYRVWLGGHARNILRRPQSLATELRKLFALRRAAAVWPRWSGLAIVTVAGRKDPASDVMSGG